MKTPKDRIQVKGGFIRILVVVVLAVLIFGGGALAKDLLLSEAKDISQLDAVAVYGRKPLSLRGIYTTTVTYSIDVADCALFQTRDGYDHLVIKDLPSLTNPGQPQLPMKTLVTKLVREAEVLGIEVVGGSYREILNPVNLAPGPDPYIWMREQDIPEQLRERLRLASHRLKTYGLDEYFPAEIATYSAGRDNHSSSVYIRVFPVRYIPMRNKAILVTDAEINVYYSLPIPKIEAFTSPIVDPAECVIICPPDLKPAAELLRDFHVNEENVFTSILTTEDIDANYPAAPEPVYNGYKDDYTGKDKIVGYNYELARKIISYLRDQEAHPNLKYVTLLGDGELIPPSYYINEYGELGWEFYYDWIPTDFLYASPDYDFVPNYRVGRLPVSDAAEAASVVSKLESWHSSLSWDWFKQATLGGGRPFGTVHYYGELSIVDLINKDAFNGMELTKCYYTDETFDVNHVEPFLSTEDTGLFYHVDHGSGYEMWVGYDSIDASEVMAYPLNPEVPVVVSVACINGAYDTDLTNFLYQPEFPAVPYPTSFGQSILLSDAGGIAYVGGSRLNYAGWSVLYDQGRLLATHYYMNQMCNSVFESYHTGANRLGDMTCDALKRYAQDNDMDSSVHKETLFGFVLLGDPVLTLPAQQSGPDYQKPYLVALDPNRYTGESMPRYEDLPLDLSQSISVASNSDSPTVDAKSIYLWEDTIIDRSSPNVPPATHTFTPPGCGYCLVRSSGEDGKEGWLYLNAQFAFIPTSDLLLIDGDNGANFESYYTDTLDDLGRTYDIWEAGARDPIDTETLIQYLDGIVIWAIPFYPTPSDGEKAACQFYLDSGGRLFITGQDIGYYLTWAGDETDYFYEHYLHAQFVKDYSGIHTLSGVPEDFIGDGLTITIWGGDGAGNQYWPEEIDPISPAVPVFVYATDREGALRVDTGTYKVVYFGFGFEGINSQADRNEVMKRVLGWLKPWVADGPIENLSTGRKYDYIQFAVWDAEPGDEIVASEGIYHENVNFRGKNLTVGSTNPNDSAVVAATVINGGGRGSVVTFSGGEDANCLLTGFTITNGGYAIYCESSSPTISNCTIAENVGIGIYCLEAEPTITNCAIADNGANGIRSCGSWEPAITNCTIVENGAGGIYSDGSSPTIVTNCIIWDNSGFEIGGPAVVTYSNVRGGWPGLGNIDTDPCFVNTTNGDYHLKSQGWRWDSDANQWTWDDVTSRCIDAGNPGSPLGDEPLTLDVDLFNRCGQNLRINMGAYGGTAVASMPPYDWAILSDITNDGAVDFADLAHWTENWLSSGSELPGDLDRNEIVDMLDYALFAQDWFLETTWHE